MFDDIEFEKLMNDAIEKYNPEVKRDKKGRFKPGYSGNKKGRTIKKLNNIKDVINDILKNKTALTISGKNKQANLLIALIYKLIVGLLQDGTAYQIIKFLETFKSYIDLESICSTDKYYKEDSTELENLPNPQEIMSLIYHVMDERYGINRMPKDMFDQQEEQ
ncbi:MAG: DUF5681 domain-containing protein [Candidatus Gastranaerophilaceae bacterium]